MLDKPVEFYMVDWVQDHPELTNRGLATIVLVVVAGALWITLRNFLS